ncbi:MAG: tetratricopeptide repeat protein [Gemmatimonadales bacterium]
MRRSLLTHRTVLGALVALVAVAATWRTTRNFFAQDDVGIVIDDPRNKSMATWDQFLDEAYWPAPYRRDLFRPLTSLLIAGEMQAGQGATISFKVMQVAFYTASAIAVFALALRLLPPGAALATGLLFAAHPVHVEATALAVTQAEVMVGLLAALAAAWYLDRRRSGWPTTREHAGLAAVTLIAANFKESGVMIPALLFALEVFVLPGKWWERWRELSRLVVWQTLAVVTTLALRARIPFENAQGSFVAEAFDGMPIGSRFLTMLSVVPEWFRLMLWPATLSADYGPQVIMPAEGWGLDQTIGLAILVLVGALAWRLRRRAPVLTFGVAWCAIGLFPVSNVIIPTGIPLAERTLFLPSIGAMLAVGAFLAGLPAAFPARRELVTRVTAAGVALVAVLGISRSMARHASWRNSHQIWAQTVIDVPDSYRARVAFGTLLYKGGYQDRAIYSYEQALALWDKVSGPNWQLAEWYRARGDCGRAIPVYMRTLELTEFAPARSSLIACLAWVGRYAEAKRYAFDGVGSDTYAALFRIWYRTVDSALKVNAPAGTVVFPTARNANLFTDTPDTVRAER